MLIVHGSLKTCGSSIVASYRRWSGPTGVITLHHVQCAAVEISDVIEPRFVIEIGYVDHQRIALPVPARVAHPELHVGRVR